MEGSEASAMNDMAYIDKASAQAGEWCQVESLSSNDLKVAMALQLIGGDFRYEVR